MNQRLSVTLDGKPVYLYRFIYGSYEDRTQLLYAHIEELTQSEIVNRVRAVLKLLPTEIEIDISLSPAPDLFEQALMLAGFVPVEVPCGFWLRDISVPSTEREWLERSLDKLIAVLRV